MLGETLWHNNRDSNIAYGEDYYLLATWSEAVKKDRLERLPDRWAQALLTKLLARAPSARPPSMDRVLRHPFFTTSYTREAPALPAGLKNHFFLRRVYRCGESLTDCSATWWLSAADS